MKHDGGWKRRASAYVYETPWFKVRRDELTLPGGEEITYSIVEQDGYVMVVPLLDDGRVVMERIYRYPVQETMLECPSGGLDGETPEAAGRRELEEETGYRAQELTELGRFVGSDGYSSEEFGIYLATGLTADGVIKREVTEQMEVELIPLEDLRAMVLRGEVRDSPSALALLLAWEHVQRT